MGDNRTSKWNSPEFQLVKIMLIVLTILVFAVLLTPPLLWVNLDPANEDMAKDFMEYKKTILSILITAFGAWVGAGAAYFFGRENLKIAAQSMLDMRSQSPRERLRQTPIRAVPPKPLGWSVKNTDPLDTVLTQLKGEEDRWFIPIVKDDGALDTVLHEEAIWRFVEKQNQDGVSYDDIKKQPLSEVVTFINTLPAKVIKRLLGIYVAVSPEKTAGEAHELMNTKGVFIAVVVDEKGKPQQYIDTGDIRSLLMRLD